MTSFITQNENLIRLSKRFRGPCEDCLIAPTCTRSFVEKTVCEKYLAFIEELLEKAKKEVKQ